VIPFDQEAWEKQKFNVALKTNRLKFKRNMELRKAVVGGWRTGIGWS